MLEGSGIGWCQLVYVTTPLLAQLLQRSARTRLRSAAHGMSAQRTRSGVRPVARVPPARPHRSDRCEWPKRLRLRTQRHEVLCCRSSPPPALPLHRAGPIAWPCKLWCSFGFHPLPTLWRATLRCGSKVGGLVGWVKQQMCVCVCVNACGWVEGGGRTLGAALSQLGQQPVRVGSVPATMEDIGHTSAKWSG